MIGISYRNCWKIDAVLISIPVCSNLNRIMWFCRYHEGWQGSDTVPMEAAAVDENAQKQKPPRRKGGALISMCCYTRHKTGVLGRGYHCRELWPKMVLVLGHSLTCWHVIDITMCQLTARWRVWCHAVYKNSYVLKSLQIGANYKRQLWPGNFGPVVLQITGHESTPKLSKYFYVVHQGGRKSPIGISGQTSSHPQGLQWHVWKHEVFIVWWKQGQNRTFKLLGQGPWKR